MVKKYTYTLTKNHILKLMNNISYIQRRFHKCRDAVLRANISMCGFCNMRKYILAELVMKVVKVIKESSNSSVFKVMKAMKVSKKKKREIAVQWRKIVLRYIDFDSTPVCKSQVARRFYDDHIPSGNAVWKMDG